MEIFNVQETLKNSAFYPASGIDGCVISELIQEGITSFVHVDYALAENTVRNAMENHFQGVGYECRVEHIEIGTLTPHGFKPRANFPFNEHELGRLQQVPIRDRFQYLNFTHFALFATYTLNSALTGNTKGKAAKFSILHIGGEACATFDALYLANGINPTAVAIICAGEGFGENWTLFTNPDFRLYQMLKMNCENNQQLMPRFLITNGFSYDTHPNGTFWPNYRFYRNTICGDLGFLDFFRLE